jgi:mannose-1-phosphate guanylyltransferase
LNLDTGVGILLGASYIAASDPNATVVIFPSDHFIAPKERFLEQVRRAALLAERMPERLILLGAVPDRPEPEFGWIEPGSHRTGVQLSSRQAPLQVLSFREKPSDEDA